MTVTKEQSKPEIKPEAPKPKARESIAAIVDRFVDELYEHPDARILSFQRGGGVHPSVEIKHLGPHDQHTVSIKFVCGKK